MFSFMQVKIELLSNQKELKCNYYKVTGYDQMTDDRGRER